MKTIKLLCCICLLGIALPNGFSQQKYTFDAYSGSYTNLENAEILIDSGYPDFYDEVMIEVDFPIYYFGKKIYSVLVKNQGEIIFGNLEERAELLPVRLKIKHDSQISYLIEGGANCGNRILKIEYRNMGFKCDPTGTYFTNVQLWIYQHTGEIEIHFGESHDNPAIYSTESCNGKFHYGSRLRFRSDFSAMPFNDPDQPDFYQGNLSGVNHYGIGEIPGSGTVYRFDPGFAIDDNFKLTPNPARYSTRISPPVECGDYQLRLFNIQGQLLVETKFPSSGGDMNISNLNPGVYFIQLWDKEKQKGFVKKLLKL